MKNIIFLLFLISFVICSGLSSNVLAQKNKSKIVAPEKPDLEAGVEDVTFDKEKAITECWWQPIYSKMRPCSDEGGVEVTTVSKTAEKDNLTYYYIVSGGKIVGQGAKITWDLGRVRPGEYKMMVGVGKDGIMRGKTVVKSIHVELCECEAPPCSCPTISVSGPTEWIKPGEQMVFRANMAGGSQDTESYNWSVSDGTIIKGQGTPQIVVQTMPAMLGKNVTATVELGGLCPECPRTASATGEIKGCDCSSISASGPTKPAAPGELMIFTADLSGGTDKDFDNLNERSFIKYKWTISDGTIIHGQNAAQIVVQTTPEMAGKTITATVEIEGLCPACPKTASAKGEVAGKKPKALKNK